MTDATPTTIYAHGTGGLLSAPGLGGPRRRKRRVPRRAAKQRTKSVTLAQLEAFVSSPAYTPDAADALAARIPELPRLKGESLGPGITRIHGNLCNVHGRYGPCDASLSGKKPRAAKPAKGRARTPRAAAKPKKIPLTPEQRAEAHATQQQANVDAVAKRMAESDTGLAPAGVKALVAFAGGTPPDAQTGAAWSKMGLAEQAKDGSFRMTPTGHAVVSAMKAGDYQRAIDAISRGTDTSSRHQERAQAAQARTQAAQAKRDAAQAKQAARLAKQGKQPRGAKPAKAPAPAVTRAPAPPKLHGPSRTTGGSVPKVSAPKPIKAPARAPALAKPAVAKPAKAPAAQLAPALTDAAGKLSAGTASASDVQTLVRNGLAKVGKNGAAVLTAAGLRATKKDAGSPGDYLIALDRAKPSTWHLRVKRGGTPDHGLMGSAWVALHSGFRGNVYQGPGKAQAIGKLKALYVAEQMPLPSTKSFTVFKDARGQYRWVAFSSTAYRDRDGEIVSTKALADDCAYADRTGQYGVLDWWHMPSLVLGDCDFNAMHGRVLIESGTFRSPAIAEKVARADLEVSLSFLHSPTNPDAHGVFHSIRRFARALTPRGKASNLFTSFHVKESPMDDTKKAALKALGFSDTDITDLETRAAQTQKAADAQGVAYKAEEPDALPDLVINGVTYKASPPKAAAAAAPDAEDAAEPPETPGEVPDAEDIAEGPEEEDDLTGETFSPGDWAGLDQRFGQLEAKLDTLAQALDLVKTMSGHVEKFGAALGTQQATKDAERAETQQQIAALATAVQQITGDQPAVPYRASAAKDTVLSDLNLLAAAKSQQPGAGPWDDMIEKLGITPQGALR